MSNNLKGIWNQFIKDNLGDSYTNLDMQWLYYAKVERNNLERFRRQNFQFFTFPRGMELQICALMKQYWK